jgi:hypothetical protein
MLGVLGAYVAWRLMWRLLRPALLLAGVVAVVLLASHGHLTIGRLGAARFWRSQGTALQRDVQRAVQHGLRPSPASALHRR